MPDKDPVAVEVYRFRHHVEAAIVAALGAARKIGPAHGALLTQVLMKELREIPQEVKRGGAPARLPVRELIRDVKRGTITT